MLYAEAYYLDYYIPEYDYIVLTVDVRADPAPTATWQLNGGDLLNITIAE